MEKTGSIKDKIIENKGVAIYISLLEDSDPSGNKIYGFNKQYINEKTPSIEIFNSSVKAEHAFNDFYYEKIQSGWKDIDDPSYGGNFKAEKVNGNTVHVFQDEFDELTAICINNTGLDGFDMGVRYILLGIPEDGYYKMLNKYGEEVNCSNDRFSIEFNLA